MNITKETQDKIKRLLPIQLRLTKDGERYSILLKIYKGKKFYDNSDSLQFLQLRRIIDLDNKITPIGTMLMMANIFEVSVFSFLLLSKVYVFQAHAPSDTSFPRITLLRLFSNFASKETINARVTDLRNKELVHSPGHNQLMIPIKMFNDLSAYQKDIITISDYFDNRNERAESLITSDPLIQQNITQNQKILSTMDD